MKRSLAIASLGLFSLSPTFDAQSTLSKANPVRGPIRSAPSSGASPMGSLTLYTDRDAWATAAGIGLTLIDFDSFPSGTVITNQLAAQGVTAVTGSSPVSGAPNGFAAVEITSSAALPFAMFTPGLLPSEPNFISTDLAPPIFGTGELTFTLAAPSIAAGAYYADSGALGGQTIEVFSGGASLGTVLGPLQNLPASFIGVVSTIPFDSVRFSTETFADSWGLDDLEFGGAIEVTIDFDNIAGQPGTFPQGGPIELERLIDVEYHSRGVIFDSAGGGIGLAASSNPVSPPNAVTATEPGPAWSYTDPVTATFWRGNRPGVVDHVQTTLTNSSSSTTLLAFDTSDVLLGSDSGGASAILRIDAPGIRSVRIVQGPMAFDDFTFGAPQAVGGLALSQILPGQAGCRNRMRVLGGEPGGTVVVSAQLGLEARPRIGAPVFSRKLLVALDARGDGELSFLLPASTAGLEFTARAISSTGAASQILSDVLAPPEGPSAPLQALERQRRALTPVPPVN